MTWTIKSGSKLCYSLACGFVGFTLFDSMLAIPMFSGPSMEPTICENDIGLLDKMTPYKKYRRGDIVIATSPTNPSIYMCKRLLALEGDKIAVGRHGMSNENKSSVHHRKLVVPRGHVWLEGDNKDNSTDSRQFGPIPMGLVQGRLLAKISPDFKWTSINVPVDSA